MNAIAVIKSETVNGVVHFHQCRKHRDCVVTIDINGPPGKVSAIHVHEFGDTSGGCASLGPHFNPHGTTHGSIFNPGQPRHAGDMINNVEFDSKGRFYLIYPDPLIQVSKIYGRSVVVHDGVDDLGLGGDSESLKTGNAGGRIACAVIGRAK